MPTTPEAWRLLWQSFDTPVDNDRLTEHFRQFPAGTPVEDAHRWFDAHSPQGVYLLMYPR